MALEIVFLDGTPPMELGAKTRIRVMSRDAEGDLNPMLLKDVAFSYSPHAWGRVGPSADPAVGVLEVVSVVESEDLLLAPTYSISASLTHFTGHTFQTERRVRLLATALEVELGFEVGQGGKWKRFAAGDLKQPIDWTRARVGDPATQSLVVREGRAFLRIASLDALPAHVAITLPNGEVTKLSLEGALHAAAPGEARPAPAPVPTPAPAPGPVATPAMPAPIASASQSEVQATPQAPGPDDDAGTHVEASLAEAVHAEAGAEPAPAPAAALPPPAPQPAALATVDSSDLRDELARLRRYVTSFATSLRGARDAKVHDGIRQRIQREVERVRDLLQRHTGPDHEELLAQLEATLSAAPVSASRA